MTIGKHYRKYHGVIVKVRESNFKTRGKMSIANDIMISGCAMSKK